MTGSANLSESIIEQPHRNNSEEYDNQDCKFSINSTLLFKLIHRLKIFTDINCYKNRILLVPTYEPIYEPNESVESNEHTNSEENNENVDSINSSIDNPNAIRSTQQPIETVERFETHQTHSDQMKISTNQSEIITEDSDPITTAINKLRKTLSHGQSLLLRHQTRLSFGSSGGPSSAHSDTRSTSNIDPSCIDIPESNYF